MRICRAESGGYFKMKALARDSEGWDCFVHELWDLHWTNVNTQRIPPRYGLLKNILWKAMHPGKVETFPQHFLSTSSSSYESETCTFNFLIGSPSHMKLLLRPQRHHQNQRNIEK